ncbi:MAG: glycosyltransferase family 1 protein [Candidatus Moraniibacteriota bacterium]
MKIGIDIRLIGKQRTGDEVVFFNLVKNLARIATNHKFELLTDIADEKILREINERLGIEEKDNFKLVALAAPHLSGVPDILSQREKIIGKIFNNRFVWNFWTLPKYLRVSPVDIYLTQYITPFFVPRKIKIVTIIHDISFNFFLQFIKFADLFFLRILIPMSLKRADKIVAVSQFTKNEIIKFYKTAPAKVDYIYNAVGEDFLTKQISEAEKEKVREKYQLPEKFILYLGTLQPRKNIPQLLEAFARIKDDLVDVKLVIGGNLKAHNADGRIIKAVEKFQLERDVFLPGFIDEQDKVALFSLAKVFVFPSLYEGFGIPPLEAMSQGVPVLCSRIESLQEVVAEGALFFEPNDVADFAKKLLEISLNQELRAQLIAVGKTRASFFAWEKTASEMLAVFEKM